MLGGAGRTVAFVALRPAKSVRRGGSSVRCVVGPRGVALCTAAVVHVASCGPSRRVRQAIRIIQVNERGRQGRARARNKIHRNNMARASPNPTAARRGSNARQCGMTRRAALTLHARVAQAHEPRPSLSCAPSVGWCMMHCCVLEWWMELAACAAGRAVSGAYLSCLLAC